MEELQLNSITVKDESVENLEYNVDDASLEILVDLAKQGDLDPWDIDLEKITTKFLKAIESNKTDNLKEAGRAIFYAAVLLRMKSDALLAESNAALNIGLHRELDDQYLLEEELAGDNIKQITFNDLESAIRRRFIQKGKRFRKLTLQDLITALQEAREEEENKLARRQQKLFDIDAYSIVAPELSGDMIDLTHSEDLEPFIKRLEVMLPEYLMGNEGIEFQALVKITGDWSNTFLAMCFLAHDNKIRFEQKEFYGELWIYEPRD